MYLGIDIFYNREDMEMIPCPSCNHPIIDQKRYPAIGIKYKCDFCKGNFFQEVEDYVLKPMWKRLTQIKCVSGKTPYIVYLNSITRECRCPESGETFIVKKIKNWWVRC